MKTLQELLAFHKNDKDKEALIDSDLKRLRFVRDHSMLEAKDSLYLAALEWLRGKNAKNPVSAEIDYEIARSYSDKGNEYKPGETDQYKWFTKKAFDLCSSATAAFPGSYGAGLCSSLKSRITEKILSLEVEEVSFPGKPSLARLAWKNVKNVWLRAIPIDIDEYQSLFQKFGYNEQERLIEKVRSKKESAEWNCTVPNDGDLQPHAAEIKIPQLPLGHYVLLASENEQFSYPGNGIALAPFWVSRISYFSRARKDGSFELYVRDRETGAALSSATVKKLERVYDAPSRSNKNVLKGTFLTDQDGKAVLPEPFVRNGNYYNPFYVDITDGKDRLTSDREFYHSRGSEETGSRFQTFFFTDRAIYRPGQTVYFKGIVLKREGDRNSIAANRKTAVEFYDVNHQKIASLDLATNEYGTMSGSFTAPQGVLNGQMQIADKWGSTYVTVEEYKRPTFEVVTNPVKGSYRLNEQITVSGQAKAYAGSSIDGAAVKYRVVRATRFPPWYCRRGGWCPSSPEMEITSGTAATNDTGGFSVTFAAIPDKTAAKSYNPTFTYTLYADVTDMSGETRSGQASVSAGYAALQLSVGVPQQVDKTGDSAFAITAANLSGTPEPTKGTVQVYKLKAPDKPFRARLWEKPDLRSIGKKEFTEDFPGIAYDDEDVIAKWPKEKKVLDQAFDTKIDSQLVVKEFKKWSSGVYALEATAKDAFGQEVKETRYFTLYSPKESNVPAPLSDWFAPIKDKGEPGEKAAFCIGSAESDVRVLYEVEHKGAIVKTAWLTFSNSQRYVEVPIEESYRGNFAVHFTFVTHGRKYQHDVTVRVPWTNKELAFSFETFRNKLQPGQKEEWKIKIAGKSRDKFAAEMVAAMYDASLDAFTPHSWNFDINPSYSSQLQWNMENQFGMQETERFDENWNDYVQAPEIRYPALNWFGFDAGGMHLYNRCTSTGFGLAGGGAMRAPAPMKKNALSKPGFLADEAVPQVAAGYTPTVPQAGKAVPRNPADQDLSAVQSRVNRNETAFFFPHLTTNDMGEILVSFTMPEALTRWKMLGFAHTKDLDYGMVTKDLVTQKELMVMPNLPRFLRENDTITLSAKVTNLSGGDLEGSAQLMLFDATTMRPIDSAFGNVKATRPLAIKKGLSAAPSWDLKIPEGVPAVAVRIVAKAGARSDGEETVLPLVTNRMLVTEALPLPMRSRGVKNFSFQKLLTQNGNSTTLRNHKLTLEFTSNPAWYAVQALPYLMEYPFECTEQLFSRYYANAIAASIANSSPRIKTIFESWRLTAPDALLSNLEKNQELKSALLEETPWVLEGKSESESKKRLGLLFDLNKMSSEHDIAQRKLARMQLSNGGWPWFEGMPDDRFITQYIVTGMGRLHHLGMLDLKGGDDGLRAMLNRGIAYLDDRISEDYMWVLTHGVKDSNNLGALQIQYLYARTFFSDIPVAQQSQKAVEYYRGQAAKYWLHNGRYLQGMIALALSRAGVPEVPRRIVKSLKENSLASEEMGMYWKEMYEGYRWYESPIEAQALYIEAFDEVAHDSASVEAMKVWLLKSKQTQNWKTTKATAEACYALLLRGTDWLSRENDVSIKLGSETVDPRTLKDAGVEAGTGYFKTSWSGSDIKPGMGAVTVTKGASGVAWGALYWQYFEQLDKIKPHATPLALSKKLFLRRSGDRGPVLELVTPVTKLAVGDKVTVRIELRVDRDVEYVHMKDMRAAGFEPLNVLSGYKWQDGLGYYESTRDLATHFFFSHLDKGTYVFEYELFATHKGDFSNGVTSIQCMYAPEFGSQSEGMRVRVGE